MAKTTNSGGAGRGTSPKPPSGGGRKGGFKRLPGAVFINESVAELRKVQWPTRQQVGAGTVVVGVVTAFFALYIALVDQAASRAILALYDRLT